MSRDLSDLKPRFLTLFNRVKKACASKGYDIRPYCTIRDPWEQAKLYRQSRTWQEIKDMIDNLERNGAPFLAEILLNVGPQFGKWITNAPPGFSWHQFGEACDIYILEDGRAIWNSNYEGYICYYDECINRNLTNLKVIGDINHCQLKKNSPPYYYKAETIDKMIKELYVK